MSARASNYVREHEEEPLVGLPERLPVGERLLWQRSPKTAMVARHVLHVNKVIAWFALIGLWRSVAYWQTNGTWSIDVLVLPFMAMCAGVGLLYLLAYLYARTTVYSLTTRRVTLRFGIAVQITMNVPFSKIKQASVRNVDNDSGNIALALADNARISYFVLWPHVRPWRWMSPQPMLVCVDGLDEAASILTDAVVEYADQSAVTKIERHGTTPMEPV
jgi:hypothetical protein